MHPQLNLAEVECLIFDLDDTLVASEPLCNLALQQQLAESGIVESATELAQRYRGAKLADIWADLSKRHNVPLDMQLEDAYRAKVSQLFQQQLQPTPGVADVLAVLDLPYCIASNGPRSKIELALQCAGLASYFEPNQIFSAYEVGHWKPDPALLLHAAAAMQTPAARCCLIDDSPLGLVAAHAAGMQALLYDPEHHQPHHPQRFTHWSKLAALLRKQSAT